MAVPLLARSRLSGSTLREFPTPPSISAAAICTWEACSGSRSSVTVLPDGCADLMWDGNALRVTAVQTGAVRYPVTEVHAIGLRLCASAVGPLLGLPASRLPHHTVDLSDIWGGATREWLQRLSTAGRTARAREVLEELVSRRLGAGHEPDPLVAAAVRRLAVTSSLVDEVAQDVGLSARELRRRFCVQVGLGPKHLQRIFRFHRFSRSLGAAAQHRTTLTQLATELGYSDQAHLSRECRQFSDRTPQQLLATWRAHLEPTRRSLDRSAETFKT